jgi:hypothetical protein
LTGLAKKPNRLDAIGTHGKFYSIVSFVARWSRETDEKREALTFKK